MNKKKIPVLICACLFLAMLTTIGGLYLGGMVFLKITHVDKNTLSYDTLYKYGEAYRDNKAIFLPVVLGWIITAFLGFIPILFLILLLVFGLRSKEELFGSARLANDMDLAKSHLFPLQKEIGKSKYPEILLGKMGTGSYKGQYLRFSGSQFVYIAAPTRSGKGVGIVIPNLLNYRDSTVTLDIKMENFIFTGGFRKSVGQSVYLFSPDGYGYTQQEFDKLKESEYWTGLSEEEQTDLISKQSRGELLRSHRWNPLTYIDRNPNFRDGEIMIIGKILFPTSGGDNDVWNELASNLFKGLVLYMLDNESSGMPVTMAQLLSLTSPEGGLNKWMDEEIAFAKGRNKPLSASCVAEFNRFLAAPEKTQGSILSNLTAPLAIFGSVACAAATSGDDFDLRDVRKKRMSIYLGLAPTSLDTYSRLVNLFFSQLISVNTKELPEHNPELKYQCLLVLDEFTSMGRVGIIQKSIAYTAGYNMRYMIIVQTRGQLEDDKLYGVAGSKALIDNCAVQLIYPPKTVNEEAELVSKTIGKKTVKANSKSKSKTKGGNTSGSNQSDSGRDVMMPQEVVDLGRIEYKGVGLHEIIIMEKVKPFIANKIIYFDEPEFIQRQQYSKSNIVDVPLLKLGYIGFSLPKPENVAVPQ
ncbi:type IV secretory system conjugative DNA transfer family protein, partial [Yersinia aldovae]|uniref:type IV secretory system conjugative DNA transfer family protein n=1 Tax=Yersinia aldovae TaxID=29483 RepID=UPI00069F3E60